MFRSSIRGISLISIIIIQIWFVYITINFPYVGISVEKNTKNEWVINGLEEGIAKSLLKLQLGDKIIKIDDFDPDVYFTIQKWREIEQSETILISRDGSQFKVSTRNFSTTNFELFPLYGAIIGSFIALMLYIRIKKLKSVKFLSLVFMTIGLIYTSFGASVRGDVLGKVSISSLMMVLPILFLHFLIVFFKEKGNIQLPMDFLKYLYGIVVFLTLLELSYFIPKLAYPIYKISVAFTLIYFIFGFILNIFILSMIYFKYRKENSYLSTLIKSVWFSILLSVIPIITLSLIPQLLLEKVVMSSVYTSWFILFFPLSFLYLIATKRVYDIELVLRRIMYMMIISILPSALIVGLNAVIFQNDATISHLFLSFVVVIIIITLVLYSLEYFATKLEFIIFPRKHQMQVALKNIARNLRSISSFLELKDIILADIVNTLQIYGCAIIFKYKNEMESIGQGDINIEEVEELLAAGSLEESFYSCFEINSHEEYTSYLITTSKKTKTMLGVEDSQWLNLIITYLAVSMENAYLIRKLTMKLQKLSAQIPNEQAGQDLIWFRKSMFEIQEKERFRIATDLHDTTMQDILLVKSKLTPLLDRMGPTEDKKALVGIMHHLELVNENLRQSCFELHPYLLQRIGLVNTIEKLIDMESGAGHFDIQYSAEGKEAIDGLNMEAKRHIFRMIQELINNAKKHSQANKVKFKLTSINDDFCLDYEDNGVGFDLKALEEDERLTNISNSGIGLEQMKSRILHLNGYVEIDSRPGKGVRINIRIPMKEDMSA